MNIVAKNITFNSEDLIKQANSNLMELERVSRESPLESSKYSIGYVLPLGTLGNAPNKDSQFKSNFQIVAYTIADNLLSKEIDFEDFNIADDASEQGQLAKLNKRLNCLSEEKLGKGWKITIFNVKLATAITSMCKGNSDIDSMQRAMEDLYSIAYKRIEQLATGNDILKYELIELFYTPLEAISHSFTKVMEKDTAQSVKIAKEIKECNAIQIETLVYDGYANGLRLLTNKESFASSKIRQYNNSEEIIHLYVLKARISGDNTEFRPIRQFNGDSKVSGEEEVSGCAERIVYNLVNKNYKHWSFISLPTSLKIELSDMK